KLFVIASGYTNFYNAKYDSIPLHEAVEGSRYLFLDTGDDLNVGDHIYKIEDDLKDFMDSI
ncbi:MAG: hypothetical protein IK021_00155, partial [Methanobrevibacter sp.]|nr:hypothetical protein [Methanobrevibacter sp.]